jgi:hypothetical protein
MQSEPAFGLPDQLSLCAPVSITEWMNGVDLTEVKSASSGEIPEVPKNIRFGIKVRVHIGDRVADPRFSPSLARSDRPRHIADEEAYAGRKALRRDALHTRQ